ncbi:MAG: hypothetical protein FWB98_00615 [Defluviitaleaceae bacterium]|nr:hypothetical protein [Defluviitaleaceae bacterium]
MRKILKRMMSLVLIISLSTIYITPISGQVVNDNGRFLINGNVYDIQSIINSTNTRFVFIELDGMSYAVTNTHTGTTHLYDVFQSRILLVNTSTDGSILASSVNASGYFQGLGNLVMYFNTIEETRNAFNAISNLGMLGGIYEIAYYIHVPSYVPVGEEVTFLSYSWPEGVSKAIYGGFFGGWEITYYPPMQPTLAWLIPVGKWLGKTIATAIVSTITSEVTRDIYNNVVRGQTNTGSSVRPTPPHTSQPTPPHVTQPTQPTPPSVTQPSHPGPAPSRPQQQPPARPGPAPQWPASDSITLRWDSGAVYVGSFVNLQPHGWGTMWWPDGSVFQGSWNNGWRTRGTHWRASGNIAQGDFVNNWLNGQGTVWLINGDIYSGGFAGEGLRSGWGTYWWHNGNIIQGWFTNDLPNGTATFWWHTGNVSQGNYINNNAIGGGTHWWNNAIGWGTYWRHGNVYQGNWTYGHWGLGTRTGHNVTRWSQNGQVHFGRVQSGNFIID